MQKTSVHDAMTRAQHASKEQQALVPYSFKVDEDNKETADQLCRRNCTTLPEFLRQCVAGLIADYSPRRK